VTAASQMIKRRIRITHIPSGTVLAEGPLGWGITPFEGNLYIREQHLRTNALRLNAIPGFCPYKFLYIWLDLCLPGHQTSRNLGWKYVVPNPLFPFIAFRTALPRAHPELRVEEFTTFGEGERPFPPRNVTRQCERRARNETDEPGPHLAAFCIP
jgi:uncharacterized protein (DUF427 family)